MTAYDNIEQNPDSVPGFVVFEGTSFLEHINAKKNISADLNRLLNSLPDLIVQL